MLGVMVTELDLVLVVRVSKGKVGFMVSEIEFWLEFGASELSSLNPELLTCQCVDVSMYGRSSPNSELSMCRCVYVG